jgi:EpsI family protein
MIKKQVIIIMLLMSSIGAGMLLPGVKYEGSEILKTIDIPRAMPGWRSKDFASEINVKGARSDFIGDIFSRVYVNRYGENLLFTILDAGNFHDPKMCYWSSGFDTMEMEDTEFSLGGNNIEAPTVLLKNGGASRLLIYWICIDKKISNWRRQKMIELWSSIVNKKKAGLMVRIEIPTREGNVGRSIELARLFFDDIYSTMTPEHAEYVFGGKEKIKQRRDL